MASLDLTTRWHIATMILRRARRALPGQNDPEYVAMDKELEEFIAHNELGLALDVLEEIAALVPCRGGFWRDLERAAIMMELGGHAERFRAHFLATKPIPN